MPRAISSREVNRRKPTLPQIRRIVRAQARRASLSLEEKKARREQLRAMNGQRLPAAPASVPVTILKPGTPIWRVAAVGSNGKER